MNGWCLGCASGDLGVNGSVSGEIFGGRVGGQCPLGIFRDLGGEGIWEWIPVPGSFLVSLNQRCLQSGPLESLFPMIDPIPGQIYKRKQALDPPPSTPRLASFFITPAWLDLPLPYPYSARDKALLLTRLEYLKGQMALD